jgi:hypothetical protein
MKKLITLLALVLIVSCQNTSTKHCTYKYKKGDIVYLKLDGTKIMIARRVLVFEEEPTYEIYYKNHNGSYGSDYIEEFALTNKPQ